MGRAEPPRARAAACRGNEKLGGCEVNITDEQLKSAPHDAAGEEWKWDRTQGQRIYDYYGVPPYWPLM